MTETLPPLEPAVSVEKKSSPLRFFVPVLGGIAAIGVVGFFASQAGLDKELIRQRVDAFAAAVHAQGAAQGKDVAFTYRDITMQGGLSDRFATILSPQFSIAVLANAPQKQPQPALLIGSEKVDLLPKAVDLSALQVRIAKPIVFSNGDAPEKSLLTVTSPTPLLVDVAQNVVVEGLSGEGYWGVTHALPTALDFTYLRERQAEGKEDATPSVVSVYETLKVTQAEGGLFSMHKALDGSGAGDLSLALRDVTLTAEARPHASIRAEEVRVQFKNQFKEGKQAFSVQGKIGDVVGGEGVLPYAPLALSVDAQYHVTPTQTAEQVAAAKPATEGHPKMALIVKDFTLSTQQARLVATADFVGSDRDFLPVGTATISLTNLPYVVQELRRFGIVNPRNEGLVVAVIEQATGKKFDAITDLTLDVDRARDGAFKIGQSSFEELFAIVLRESMKGMKVVPAAPVSGKPAPVRPSGANPVAEASHD